MSQLEAVIIHYLAVLYYLSLLSFTVNKDEYKVLL